VKEDFVEDSRYQQCNKESFVTLLYFLLHMVVVGGIGLAIGYNKGVDQIKFIAGFPSWFFYSSIIGWIFLSLVPIFMIKYYFTDMSLEPEGDN
jgi:uncharacterized membrane protein YhdT